MIKQTLQSFKDLTVWKKSYELSLKTYKLSSYFPNHETYGLSSQMRRASVSVLSNISEGYARKGRGEYIQFLHIAYGSLAELETQLLLSHDLRYISRADIEPILSLRDETAAMLFTLIQKLISKSSYSVRRTLNPVPCTLNPVP